MKVKSKMDSPVKMKDGTWDIVITEFEEDIPDLGRHSLLCNSCGFSGYPECIKHCEPQKK